jgi:kynurenine formamidase
MKFTDLSHTLENGMMVFPGDEAPMFQKIMTHVSDGAQAIRMDLSTHHGTHIDCPLHFVPDGKAADTSGLENFYGKAVIADCTKFGVKTQIDVGYFNELNLNWDAIDWLIVYTGWYRHWGTAHYLEHFPVITVEAARFLAGKNLKGIGLDVISIDAIDSVDYPVHHIILGSGMYLIENLCNLHQIPAREFTLAAFPLKITQGDGSPIRAVALTE